MGEGIVILAAFPLTGGWSNLPMKPEFVPLVLRLINHAERRADVDCPAVVAPETIAEIAVSGAWGPASGRVTDEAGHATDVAFEKVGGRLLGAYERTATQGYYRVDVKGARADASHRRRRLRREPRSRGIAIAAGREEDLRQWLSGVKLTVVDASAEGPSRSMARWARGPRFVRACWG